MVVGRSKEGSFIYIIEWSWGKVKGWKGQVVSKAAKGVMVELVLQAFPMYPMSNFQFSKKLNLNFSSFWWGLYY
jgi:hypothetical protein